MNSIFLFFNSFKNKKKLVLKMTLPTSWAMQNPVVMHSFFQNPSPSPRRLCSAAALMCSHSIHRPICCRKEYPTCRRLDRPIYVLSKKTLPISGAVPPRAPIILFRSSTMILIRSDRVRSRQASTPRTRKAKALVPCLMSLMTRWTFLKAQGPSKQVLLNGAISSPAANRVSGTWTTTCHNHNTTKMTPSFSE